MTIFDRNIPDHTEAVFELANVMFAAAKRCGCAAKAGLALKAINPSNEPIDWFGLELNGSKFSIGVLRSEPSVLIFLTGTHRIDKEEADRLGIGEIYESRWPNWSGPWRLRRKLELPSLSTEPDPAEKVFEFLKESLDLAVQIAEK